MALLHRFARTYTCRPRVLFREVWFRLCWCEKYRHQVQGIHICGRQTANHIIGTGFHTSVEAAVAYARFQTTQRPKSGLARISKPVLEKSKRCIRSCRDELGSFDVAEEAASAVAMRQSNASWQVGEVRTAPASGHTLNQTVDRRCCGCTKESGGLERYTCSRNVSKHPSTEAAPCCR